MSPDRTAPTTLRPAPAPRTAAPEAPADGFAALLGAAGVGDPCDGARPGTEPEAGGDVAAVAVLELDSPATPIVPVPVTAPPLTLEIAAPAVTVPLPIVGSTPQPPAARVESLPGVPVPVSAPLVAVDAAPPATAWPLQITGTAPQPAQTLPGTPAPVTGPPAATVEAGPVETPQGTTPTVPAGSESVSDAPAVVPGGPVIGVSSNDAGATGEQGTAPREQASPAPAPAPAPGAPAQQPSPTVAPLPQRAAPLHQAPRAVAQMLQVAVEHGISHAKLNLRPAELGGIEIRLQTSTAGVTAQVIADSPEAARLLHQAADDLRRSLERHDVTLLSLDVSTAGDGRPDGSAGASADLAGDRARHFAALGLTPPTAAEADEPPTVVETVQMPDGLHIDVFA